MVCIVMTILFAYMTVFVFHYLVYEGKVIKYLLAVAVIVTFRQASDIDLVIRLYQWGYLVRIVLYHLQY